MLALILFGPPGSGKGTQARLLETHLGIPHISTGDMLRERIEARDPAGLQVKATIESGRLAPDVLVNRLVTERIAQPEAARGFILDGYPRTLEQAKMLDQWIAQRGIEAVVVYLKVDYTKVIARLTGRRQCPLCGTLYSLSSNPPKADDVCDLDGVKLAIREDDREQAIRERLEAYEASTRPLLDYFRDSGYGIYAVDGASGSPEEITMRIRELISVAPKQVE